MTVVPRTQSPTKAHRTDSAACFSVVVKWFEVGWKGFAHDKEEDRVYWTRIEKT